MRRPCASLAPLARLAPLATIAVLLSAALAAEAATLIVGESGDASLYLDGFHDVGLSMGVFGPGWAHASQAAAELDPAAGSGSSWTYSGSLAIPGAPGAVLDFVESASATSSTSFHAAYSFTFSSAPAGSTIETLHVSVSLPVALFAGKPLTIDGQAAPFVLPLDYADINLLSVTTTGFAAPTTGGGALSVTVASPVQVIVQDNRAWGSGDFEVRFVVRGAGGITAGEQHGLDLTLEVTPDLETIFEPESTATDVTGWLPFPFAYDQEHRSTASTTRY